MHWLNRLKEPEKTKVYDKVNALGNRLIELGKKRRSLRGEPLPDMEELFLCCINLFTSKLLNGHTPEEARDAGHRMAEFGTEGESKEATQAGYDLVDAEYGEVVFLAGLKSQKPRCRVAVFGSRSFWDYGLLKARMDRYTEKLKDPIIVVGDAKGADDLGKRWAKERGKTVKVFLADLKKHGSPAAYHIRNRDMVYYAVEHRPAFAVAFWDGESKGTASTIELCEQYKVRLKVVRFRRE